MSDHEPLGKDPDGTTDVATGKEERVEGMTPEDVSHPSYTVDGRFTSEGLSISVYAGENMTVVEEAWFTWDEIDEIKTDGESHFTFELQ